MLLLSGFLLFSSLAFSNDKYIDFEDWTADSAGIAPEGWYYVINSNSYQFGVAHPTTRSENSVLGNYSLQIEPVEVVINGQTVIINGQARSFNRSQENIDPISNMPDTARFNIDYDIAADDTATVNVIYFDNQNGVVDIEPVNITGTSGGFTEEIRALAGPSDPSVVTGIGFQIIGSSQASVDTRINVDDLRLYSGGTQIYSEDFSVWNRVDIRNPEPWSSSNAPWTFRGEERVTETTDAMENNSAARIEGRLFTDGLTGMLNGRFSIDNVPTRIDYGYKYEPAEPDDQGIMLIILTNWNDDQMRRDTLGSLIMSFPEQSQYDTRGTIVTASPEIEADTIFFQIFANNLAAPQNAAFGSVLYLDHINLNFDPPEAVTLISPDSTEADVMLTPELTWHHMPSATLFDLQIATDEDFQNIVIDEEGVEDTTYSIEGNDALDLNTTYYWRVRAINQNGTGDWSSTWSFTTLDQELPEQPVLHSPEDNADDVDRTPVFHWLVAEETDNYHLQVADDDEFGNQNLFANEQSLQDTFYNDIVQLQENATYYWRVRGTNDAGEGEWSEVWTFTTGEDDVNFLSTVKQDAGTLSIYPNPASGKTSLNFKADRETTISAEVYDLNGRKWMSLVDNQRFSAGSHSVAINTTNLPEGMYIIKFNNEEGQSHTRLIVQ